jgi:3-oxoacyl-[acyl-carrier protein] reductase
VRDVAGWERVVHDCATHFGSLDVMLNIAGYLKPGFIHETAPDEIDRQIDVNVKGVMYATRVGAAQMLRQGHGHIVNIASIAGITHVPGMSVYCASKHAVRGFTLSVAHELRHGGVDVSVVCPDAVETPMLHKQTGFKEASMTFAGGRGLRLEEVEKVLLRVLEDRPMEVVIPVPRSGRAVLARIANAFPALGKLGVDRVRKQGERVQAALIKGP